MTKNKRRLMRGDEEQQRPYKRATRPTGALSELSEQVVSRLRRSVVSLASFDGDTKLRECTGICIETSCSDSEATILTSRRLVPPTWPASLTIKVRLPNDQIVTGWIEDPGIYVDFFIVNIKEVSRVDAMSLDRDIQFEPHTKAAAVCRCFSSGFLTVTSGLNLASPTSETIVSTCWIHKAGIGGPLVDFDGNFVGMNSSRTKMEKTAYVRRKQILRFLVFHRMVSVKEGVDDATQARINSEMKAIRPSLDATSIARLSESRKGALSEQVLARLSKSVAALASFHGDTKLRECTGICIESSCPGVTSFLTSINLIPLTWHASKITKNLKIKVRLPNDETVTGWIADPEIYVDFFIVNVAGVNATHVSLDRDIQFEPYRKVAAVCRNFNSGLLMDTSGVDLASPSARPDQTMFSTYQIDKVGIGGPLVDFDGNFVGMNCSCTKERKTPYVRRVAILRFLGVNGMVSVKDVVDDATRAFLKTMAGAPCYNIRGENHIINRLEDTFDEDILHNPCKGVVLEMKGSDGSLLKKTAAQLASESSKSLASEMNRSVVSLASFNGFAKKIACTGVFIECNACSATILTSASLVRVPGDAHMIDDTLRIEVCLPNKFRVVGILKGYNLHYKLLLLTLLDAGILMQYKSVGVQLPHLWT
uniref:Uncharacterized protein n=1 Tax=Triticum urartu TaxID=4572 RepID=A0A8R7QJS6_TRIUA